VANHNNNRRGPKLADALGNDLPSATKEEPKRYLVHTDPRLFEADIEPVGDTVVVRLLEQKVSQGGIHLLASETLRSQIVAVGPGLIDPEGDGTKRIPMDPEIRVGRVCYPAFASNGLPLPVGEQRYSVLRAHAICVFSKAPPEPLPEPAVK
jgi:co-chaperonin GroES (HSP10)